MSKYPEHEKLRAISDKSQTIGEFLEWLQDGEGVHLMVPLDGYGAYDRWESYTPHRIEDILAKYFKINLQVIEQEKRAMLDEIRSAQSGS